MMCVIRPKGTLTTIGLHWRYDFYLELFGKKVLVNFNDKMIMQSSDVVLNHATITKFGLKLGELLSVSTAPNAQIDGRYDGQSIPHKVCEIIAGLHYPNDHDARQPCQPR